VVIGHSQGGLITKMTAIDTGSRLYDTMASKPLDELQLRPETRALAERALFVEPLPFVRPVVFVSTLYRGSYLAEWSIGQMIARLVRLPLNVARATTEIVTANPDALRFNPEGVRFGSMYGMTPGSPFITGLAEIPVAPGCPPTRSSRFRATARPRRAATAWCATAAPTSRASTRS
jgi:hypothetical protein